MLFAHRAIRAGLPRASLAHRRVLLSAPHAGASPPIPRPSRYAVLGVLAIAVGLLVCIRPDLLSVFGLGHLFWRVVLGPGWYGELTRGLSGPVRSRNSSSSSASSPVTGSSQTAHWAPVPLPPHIRSGARPGSLPAAMAVLTFSRISISSTNHSLTPSCLTISRSPRVRRHRGSFGLALERGPSSTGSSDSTGAARASA